MTARVSEISEATVKFTVQSLDDLAGAIALACERAGFVLEPRQAPMSGSVEIATEWRYESLGSAWESKNAAISLSVELRRAVKS